MKENQRIRNEINHEPWKTLPHHEKPSPDLQNPFPQPGFSPKTRKSLPTTRFPQSWARKTPKRPPRTSSKPFIKQSFLRIPQKIRDSYGKSGIPTEYQGFLQKIKDSNRKSGISGEHRDTQWKYQDSGPGPKGL